MDIPPKSDLLWQKLLTGQSEPKFTSLATKVTVGRLRQTIRQRPDAMAAALSELHQFFLNNEFAQRDLSQI
jgi:hypothetical protein